MIVCDLCGQTRECRQRQIEESEYDICSECWQPLAEKLAGKGRPKKQRENVFLPPKEEADPEPVPGMPPTIWSLRL